MWTGYSTKDTAEVVGLSQWAVRSCVREGLLDAQPDVLPLRFSFQDLKVLQTLRSLTRSGVSIRRARRQLGALRSRCEEGRSLASMRIDAHDGHVVIRDETQVWRADSGQLVFGFQFSQPSGDVTALPHRAPIVGPEFVASLTADEWFDEAMECEEGEPARAMAAYREVLRQRPECTETLINLGRLHAETEQVDEAVACFETALDIDPCEATALYNLGVIAQDRGLDDEAIAHYQRAVSLESTLAEAHYNLATIFDKLGDARSAIRHINEFRKFSKKRR
ncbi:MAG: tetratricopeptide repeat protein [Myxococcales bacterium]|nr:tetratricopeptide repeat protein [Myxococcales bacterium]